MTRNDIVEQVNSLLVEEFEVDATLFTPEANVRDTLSLDSLSLVDLVAIIQHTYKIKIPVTDLKTIQTFTNLYDYIETHLQQDEK
ncbi:MAG: phosphopantetheine-binding protein [Tannerellaceae bacterium]|nr:phosphopantetheine-binding protein [Tannerellaceae bacterium]